MVVTSANPSEGKSTVVSNLGIAVAEVNQKVLLIDADLRKPRLHDVFNLKNDNGLSDLLRSKETVSAALAGAIQQTDVPDLYVLTSGSEDLGGHQPALLQPHAGAACRSSAPSLRPSSSTRRPCSRFRMPVCSAAWWIA